MIDRRKSIATAIIFIALLAHAYIASADEWRALSERTRARMAEMDEIIRDPIAERSYDRYMQIFAPGIRAYGLVETGATDLAGLREHYHPVFFEFRDGVLLSDDVIVAGDMAAQRYHSMLYLDGEFDGTKASGKPVYLRGQTFFRFDASNRIAERWSNHDHAFRMQQLMGEAGSIEGAKIAAVLNGPGLSEADVLDRLASMNRDFNLIASPAERHDRYIAFFRDDAKVHGLGSTPAGVTELSDYMRQIWTAFPDLLRVDEARLTAWSFGAVRWRALGSHRKAYKKTAATMRPTLLRGEAIMRFDREGKIAEIWINDAQPMSP